MDKNKKELHQADKSIYIDSAEYGGSTNYVAKVNIDTWCALAKYHLSGDAIHIFAAIWFKYEQQGSTTYGKYQPIMLSYDDISNIALCSYDGARKAIKQLIKNNLITQSRCGEGRTKSGYMPNVDELHNLTKLYLENKSAL